MNNIVLTGASGFIGSHVAEYFCNQGLHPVCMVRNMQHARFLNTIPVTTVQGDIRNADDVRRAFGNADLVIHTAAKVGEWGSYGDFHEVNVDGTINVINAAHEAGIHDVIITGSNSCYGEESSQEIKSEATEYNPHYAYFMDALFPSALNHYRDTKTLANVRAMELASQYAINLSIIEPVWVYGEREFHTGFYDFLTTVRSGLPFFPGSRKNKLHTIYVRDLARLYYLTARARRPGLHRYLACDGTAEYLWTLLSMFCREANLKMPKPLPKAFVYPLAFVMEGSAQLLGARSAPLLTRAKVNIFYDNIEYSAEKARSELGFESRYTREQSIRQTVAWYIEHKLL